MEELVQIKPDEYCSRTKNDKYFIMQCTEKGIVMETGKYDDETYSLNYDGI